MYFYVIIFVIYRNICMKSKNITKIRWYKFTKKYIVTHSFYTVTTVNAPLGGFSILQLKSAIYEVLRWCFVQDSSTNICMPNLLLVSMNPIMYLLIQSSNILTFWQKAFSSYTKTLREVSCKFDESSYESSTDIVNSYINVMLGK
jgi:hypothetical protein